MGDLMTDTTCRSKPRDDTDHRPAAPAAAAAPPVLDERSVLSAYARAAPLYDVVFGRLLEPGRQLMVETAARLQPQRVLEVGVGTGLTLAGYPAAAQVVGIDLSPEMLERARRRAEAMPGRDIQLELMNAEQMSFEVGSFDCVTLPYVLSVTPDPARLVREIRRVCRPDGRVLIVNHFSGSRAWWLLERSVRSLADRVGFRSDFGFEEHVLSHDWQVESVQPVNLFGLSRMVVLRNGPG
jgi:phosphatidylethanolamine/phosphatidyl-N-methylethanolamine N-methyltransferase